MLAIQKVARQVPVDTSRNCPGHILQGRFRACSGSSLGKCCTNTWRSPRHLMLCPPGQRGHSINWLGQPLEQTPVNNSKAASPKIDRTQGLGASEARNSLHFATASKKSVKLSWGAHWRRRTFQINFQWQESRGETDDERLAVQDWQ